MGSFGDRMKREREMRGITLEEIAESTKIGTRSLRALEQEDFEKLPGGIFTKGFVRAYARYLGIDEEQAVSDYMAAFGEREQQQLPEPPSAAPPSEAAASHARRNTLAAVLALVLLAAAGWQLYPRLAGAHAEPPAPPALKAETAPPPPAIESMPAPEVTASASTTKDGIVVHISAREQSWIAIMADDQPVAEATLDPQMEKTVRARSKLVVKIGNVKGVELSYNGQLVQPPEGTSNVATLTFTPEGVQR